ncbi:MAG: sensor histidine kinase [Thermoanaerobaculia bacterium]
MEDLVASAARHRRQIEFGWPGGSTRDVYLPLLVGGHAIGVLVLLRTSMPAAVLESIATLVALALERERLAHEHAHVEALRESEAAKTTLLRAASHDLVTPLTAIAIQGGRLIRLAGPDVRPIAESLAAEADRLRRRIENLLAMARLQAGAFVAIPEPTPPADLFRAAREALAALLRSRTVRVTVAETCPDLWADPALALEIVVNLVENAHRATPPDQSLDLSAYAEPTGERRVVLEIADRGLGFDLHAESRGLGLEIVQGLAHAIGAAVEFTDRPGGGMIARLVVPAAAFQTAGERE